MTDRKLGRMRRVVDQMLTAHAMLRDRYRRRALALTLIIIGLSIAGASLAFAAGDSRVSLFQLHEPLARWIGALSLVIFFFSMLDLVFDWRVRAHVHGEAAVRLSELKQQLRGLPVDAHAHDVEEAKPSFDRTMSLLIPIPDSQFAALKARHAHKVALSRAIDSHQGAPMWWIRLIVRLDGVRGKAAPSDVPDLELLDQAATEEGSGA